MSLLPPCCGVTDLLLAASPVDTVVMSLSPGSAIGHPRPPVGGVTGLQRWGGGGGEAVQSLPGLPLCTPPLHAPAEVND